MAAYRLGRIEDGRHNYFIHTGETVPIDEFVQGIADQARKEFPNEQVVIEHLTQGENGEGKWISADEFDAQHHTAVEVGETQAQGVDAQAPVQTEAPQPEPEPEPQPEQPPPEPAPEPPQEQPQENQPQPEQNEQAAEPQQAEGNEN